MGTPIDVPSASSACGFRKQSSNLSDDRPGSGALGSALAMYSIERLSNEF